MEDYPQFIADSRSASASSTPSDAANARILGSHFAGMPRLSQLETAACFRPSTAPTLVGPPRRLISARGVQAVGSDLAESAAAVSLIIDMTSPNITCCDILQHKNIDMVGCRNSSQNVVMFPKANRIDEKRDIKAAVMARVENVRHEIGETQTEFATRMGVEYKDYKGWVTRESVDLPYVIKLAQSLNISLDYLCCITDEPHPPANRMPARDFWSLRADTEKAKAALGDTENQR